jgi:hypothetical protein
MKTSIAKAIFTGETVNTFSFYMLRSLTVGRSLDTDDKFEFLYCHKPKRNYEHYKHFTGTNQTYKTLPYVLVLYEKFPHGISDIYVSLKLTVIGELNVRVAVIDGHKETD